MTVKQKLDSLSVDDAYTLILFVLYKLSDSPDYLVLSRLMYLFDRDTLLKLCEVFGGTEIKIPTVSDIEDAIQALSLYNDIDINGNDADTEIEKLKGGYASWKKVVSIYYKMKEVLTTYSISYDK